MKLNQYILMVIIGAFAFLIILPPSLAAQAGPNPPARGSRGSTSDTFRDMQQREMNIRRLEIERDTSKKPAFEVSKEAIKQVNEDFTRIQEINAEIMHDYVSGAKPDYKHISEAMAEINKRAGRLKTNLLLPPSDAMGNEQAAPNGSNERSSRSPLLDLNDLITRFITNPIFKNSETIDVATGTRAKRDLEDIIDLSHRISKSADKLSKPPGKSN